MSMEMKPMYPTFLPSSLNSIEDIIRFRDDLQHQLDVEKFQLEKLESQIKEINEALQNMIFIGFKI